MPASPPRSRRQPAARALLLVALLAGVGPLATPARAQDPDSVRMEELERRLEALTREIERLQLGGEVVEADTEEQGLGPAASKVYRVESGVSIGGYGELLYENFAAERQDGAAAGAPDRIDALRAIVYVGYKFSDRVLFNSEIEVEHADEIFLEFAYVDYRLSESVGLRGGMVLAPLGLVNELHEPPVFLGSERPVTESRIIPTTWRANGVGLFGSSGPLTWRAYLMNSLDGAGFSAAGLRGGRQKGSKALAEDMGVAARLDYDGVPGLVVGASGYVGGTGQGREVDGSEVGGRVTVWDVHLDYERRGWEARALLAGASLQDVEDLNDLAGLAGSEGIGSAMRGWYVQLGYDVLRTTPSPHQLIPYVRHERVDTQRAMAAGAAPDPANDLTVTSLGLAWKPVPQVVAKLDYQIHSSAADTGIDQWNVALGWLF